MDERGSNKENSGWAHGWVCLGARGRSPDGLASQRRWQAASLAGPRDMARVKSRKSSRELTQECMAAMAFVRCISWLMLLSLSQKQRRHVIRSSDTPPQVVPDMPTGRVGSAAG